MAFDGLVNYTISNELKDHIVGGKIDKIFEPNDHEILLGVIKYEDNKYIYIIVRANNDN